MLSNSNNNKKSIKNLQQKRSIYDSTHPRWFHINYPKVRGNQTHHLLRTAGVGPRWTAAPGCCGWPAPGSSAIFIAWVMAFMTISPRGIRYIHWYETQSNGKNYHNERKIKVEKVKKTIKSLVLTYLAQKDLSCGGTTSPSKVSPPIISSENTGALQKK